MDYVSLRAPGRRVAAHAERNALWCHLRDAGCDYGDIAAAYGRNFSTIWSVVNGYRWWVDDERVRPRRRPRPDPAT